MLSAPPSLFLGKSIREVMPPEVIPQLEQTCREVLRTRSQGTVEYQLVIEGAPRWFEARMFLDDPLGQSGEEEYLLSVVRDVTKEKRLELELSQVTHLLQSIIDECPAVICVKDAENHNILTNKFYTRLFSTVSLGDASRYSPTASYPAVDEAVVYDEVEKRDRIFTTHHFVPSAVTATSSGDGNQGTATSSAGSAVLCTMGMEITDRKAFEKKVLLRTQELELLNENLRRANQLAEEAVQSRLTLMASLSHEIRTPMNGVIGATSMLLLSDLTEEQREAIRTIQVSGETLLQIINDLLDLAKLDSGKFELHSSPFNIQKCIEEVYQMLGSQARETGVALMFLVDPNVPQVVGDQLRLRQILLNLVSNAIKFSRRGAVFVRCHLSAGHHIPDSYCEDVTVIGPVFSADSVSLLFEVEDEGIGIPESRLPDLFLPFSQIEQSVSHNYSGTGLGLSICRRLTKYMGGSIWVKSRVGVGSTFSFVVQFELSTASRSPTPTLEENVSIVLFTARPRTSEALPAWFAKWGLNSLGCLEVVNALDADPVKAYMPPLTHAVGPGKIAIAMVDNHITESLEVLYKVLHYLSSEGFIVACYHSLSTEQTFRDELSPFGEVSKDWAFFRRPFQPAKFANWIQVCPPSPREK